MVVDPNIQWYLAKPVKPVLLVVSPLTMSLKLHADTYNVHANGIVYESMACT